MIPEGSQILQAFSLPQHIAIPVRYMGGFSAVGKTNESRSISNISDTSLTWNPCWELGSPGWRDIFELRRVLLKLVGGCLMTPSWCHRDGLQARNFSGELETEQGGNRALCLHTLQFWYFMVNQSSPGSDMGYAKLESRLTQEKAKRWQGLLPFR